MLRADFMPRSENTALQEREGRLNSIGMNVAIHVDAKAVSNCLVPMPTKTKPPRCAAILAKIISHKDFHVVRDVLSDVLFESTGANVVRMKETQLAATLPNSDNDFFAVRSASALPVCATANVRFVHLDDAAELRLVDFGHCGPNAMTEIPRGLVRLDSKRTLNLAGGHAFLCFTEKECSEKPRHKWQVRIVEDRVHGHAELVAAR